MSQEFAEYTASLSFQKAHPQSSTLKVSDTGLDNYSNTTSKSSLLLPPEHPW